MNSPFSSSQTPSVAMSSSSRDMDVLETNAEHMNQKDVLFKSLEENQSDDFIMRLLNDDADPHIPLGESGEPLLLCALRRDTMIVAQELVNKGADVNAGDPYSGTVLNKVIDSLKNYNPQAICFLLYYEGVVNFEAVSTAQFLHCFWSNNVVEILYSSVRDLEDILDTVVSFQCDTDLAFILFKKGAHLDYFKWMQNAYVFWWTLYKGGIDLFKRMWERLYYTVSIETASKICKGLLQSEALNNNDWWDGLNWLLNSSMAFELGKELQSVFFAPFLTCCKRRNIKLSDRLRIIYFALSLSIKVDYRDLGVAYDLFGFNEEFEILMYFTKSDYDMVIRRSDAKDWDLFLGMADYLRPLCKMLFLGYFNRSYYNQFMYLSSETKEKMQFLPEFPTLLELCRTPTRQFIRKTYKVKEPYQFYDAVKQLNLPRYIEDIIRFKTPIYI